MASIKKKRVSKKNKAAWRKHTDVKDVEDFLEEQRQEERIGKFSEKKDEELFKIDAVPNKRVVLSQKQKRKANALKPLRSLSALENTSKVQDPIVKRNHVKPKRSGRNIEEEILHPKTQRHIQANKDRLKYNEKLSKKLSKRRTAKDFTKDIWQEEDVRERAPGLTDTWISKDLALYTLRNIGKASIKVHDSIRHKTIKTKSFSAPHPGMSYNPSLKAHQDLISSVVEKEKGIINLEKHLKRVTTEMFSKVTPEQRDELHRKEMSSGLAVEDGGEEEDDNDGTKQDENNVPYKAINPPVENKKKSKQQRRKQKEQKVLTNEMLKKKELKQQRIDLHRIKKIVAEVDEEAEDLNKLKKHRKQVAEKKKFETKRLGRLKFQEPDQDVNMPEDIAGNLRNVKTESSLLVDRFKNFQQRNILPTSVEVNKTKRRKIKRFPRSTHKEPGVSITRKKK